MSGLLLVLYGARERQRAHIMIDNAPALARVTFEAPRRTLPQNALLHSLIGEVASQLLYHGQRLTVDDYKLVFLASLKSEMRIVPNLDGDGFVNLGRKTSRLTKEECSFLIDIVRAYGEKHGVIFGKADDDGPVPVDAGEGPNAS